jgi:hypothetical protein
MTDGGLKGPGGPVLAIMAAMAGLIMAELCARYAWFVITLDESTINHDWFRALRAPYVFIIPLFVFALLIWRALAKRSLQPRWIIVIALVASIAAECGARTRPVQQALWLAVKLRSTARGDFFFRELAYLKLGNLDDRTGDPRRIITIGTSQIIVGLNYDRLRTDFPSFSVCRRGIAGMVPLRMTSAIDSFPVRSNDVVVMYLSEADLTGDQGFGQFDADWMRPIITPLGLHMMIKCLPHDDCWRGWRQIIDLFLAAHSELWRCRDAFRTVITHPAGKPETTAIIPGKAAQPGAPLIAVNHDSQNDYWIANLKSLELIISDLVSRGAKVVAFEGQVNPSGMTSESRLQREDARREFSILFKRFGCVFVALQDQPIQLTPQDFLDRTHMNEAARDRFTIYVSEWLRNKIRTDWK